MKYALFGYDYHAAEGGANDLLGVFDSVDKAFNATQYHKFNCFQIVDSNFAMKLEVKVQRVDYANT